MDRHRVSVSDGHYGHQTRIATVDGSAGIWQEICIACDVPVAYLFDPNKFTMESSQAWMEQNKPQLLNPPQPEQSALAAKVDALVEAVVGLIEKIGLSRQFADTYLVQSFHSDFGKADEGAGWSFSAEDGNALVDKGGWALFKKCHLVCRESGTPENKGAYVYPVAKLVGGSPQYFLKAAQTVYAGLRGGARGADLPRDVEEKCLAVVKRIYKAYDRDTSDMRLELGLSRAIFQFARDEKVEGVIVNEQGWIKKPILRTGEWTETPNGGQKPLKVAMVHLQMLKQAFDDGAFERVTVPKTHADLPTENTGFVKALEIEEHPDMPGEYVLSAWIKFTDPDTEKAVRLGNVWNCSVMLEDDVVRPSDSKTFPIALRHVSLTNFPWIDNLPGFTQASRDWLTYQLLDEQGADEMELSEEVRDQLTQLAKFSDAGITIEEALELARNREQLVEREGKLQTQLLQLARTQRKSHVKEVVLALEGKHSVDGVTVVEEHRHYPAVIEATRKALESLPLSGTMKLSRDGVEQELNLESLVLSIVNAIPAEGRVALEQPVLPQGEPRPMTDETDEEEVTVEQLESARQEIFG